MRRKRTNTLAAALVLVGWCAAAGFAGADPVNPSPTPADTPKTTIDKDGLYAVGTDIVPGIYTSAGPVEGKTCYWKRVQGDTIVDNALTKRPQIVEIEATDTAFKTDHCQPWRLTTCPPDCPPSPQPLPGGLPQFPGGFINPSRGG